MSKWMMAISNHASMIGGGEYSFLDFLSNLSEDWKPLAILPDEGDLAFRLRTLRIKTRIIPLPRIRFRNILKMAIALKSYLSLCNLRKPVLLYANGSRAAFYAGIISRLLNIPMIWHCRIAQSEFLFDLFLSLLSKRIIVNSRFTAKRFHPFFKTRVKLVYNGLNITWLKSNPPSRPSGLDPGWKIILVVARFSRSKHQDLILEAFERLKLDGTHYHLIFLGAPDLVNPRLKEQLLVKIRRSLCRDRIHVLEPVDDPRAWYVHSHLLVSASENESFGRVFVEAMACGLPIVAARSGAVPEIVRDGRDGLLFDLGDQKSLKNAMVRLLTDRVLRENIIRSAFERAEYFNLAKHTKEMLNVFESIRNI